MKLIEIIKHEISLLTEGVSSILYHRTSLNALLNILKSNKILLSSSIGTSADRLGNKLYFLSFSRTNNVNLGFSKNSTVTIEFDGTALNNNYKGNAIDYWQWPNLSAKQRSESNEYEDRIFSNTPYLENLDKYITHIDIILTDVENTDRYGKIISDIKETNNSLLNKIRVFNNSKDYRLGKFNSINDINIEITDNGYDYKKGFDYRLLDQVLTILLVGDPKIDDDNYIYNFIKGYYDKFIKLGETKLETIDIKPIMYDIKNRIPYLDSDRDFLASIQSNIHNIVKSSGKTPINYEILKLLSDEMVKYKVRDILGLIKAKKGYVDNKKMLDYSAQYSFGYERYVDYILIDNSSETNLSWTLLNENERNKLMNFGYPITNKNIINYLFNNYNIEKAKELVIKLTPSYSSDILIDLKNKLIYKELTEKDYEGSEMDNRSCWYYVDKDAWYRLLYNNLDSNALKSNGSKIIKLLGDDSIKIRFIYAVTAKLIGESKTKEFFDTQNIIPLLDDKGREKRYVKNI